MSYSKVTNGWIGKKFRKCNK